MFSNSESMSIIYSLYVSYWGVKCSIVQNASTRHMRAPVAI